MHIPGNRKIRGAGISAIAVLILAGGVFFYLSPDRRGKQPVNKPAGPVPRQSAEGCADNRLSVSLPKTDSDPIVECRSAHLGTFRIRKSICDTGADCEIGGNRWGYAQNALACKTAITRLSATADTDTAAVLGESDTKEKTCGAIGFSQRRRVWTFELTPAECEIAERELR